MISRCGRREPCAQSSLAEEARAYWHEHGLGRFDHILLLPGNDAALNGRIRSAFEAKLGGREGAVVEGDEAWTLVALYSLYAFTGKLIVGSFDLPFGRKLRNLLDSGAASEEDLINDVILGGLDGAGSQV